MTNEALCPDCQHPIRFSDNEAGRCEKIVNDNDEVSTASECGHICRHPEAVALAAHSEPQPPVRYCTRCRNQIEPKRVARHATFCSPECRREDSKERRAYRGSKACRLCGRAARKVKPQAARSDVCDGSTAQESSLQQVIKEREIHA